MSSTLQRLVESVMLQRLTGKSADDVKNAFFANYLAALVLNKLQDLPGLKLINDPAHAKLTTFNSSSSDLNFWGRALFHSTDPKVKAALLPGHAELLADEAGNILQGRILKTMIVPLQAPSQVDWRDVVMSLALFKHRFELASSYFTKVAYAIYKWDTLNENGKKRAVNDSFMYLLQSDPKSALTSRLRGKANGLMINTLDDLAAKLVGFKKLHEDEGGGEATSAGNVASTETTSSTQPGCMPLNNPALANAFKLKKQAPNKVSTKSGIIIKDGKIVKKRQKKFKARKFKAPEHMLLSRAEVGDEAPK